MDSYNILYCVFLIYSFSFFIYADDSKPLYSSSLLNIFSKVRHDCENKEYGIWNCFKAKGITLLDRVARSDVIKLDDSISFVREASHRIEYGKSISENELDFVLSKNSNADMKLNELLLDRLAKFFNTHVIKIGLPQVDPKQMARSLEEGRGKMKKTMGMFMMAGMWKMMMMIPLAIGTLFILAGKALIISKIALILSLMITLKKLLAKPTEQHVVHEAHGFNGGGVVSSSGGWDRKFKEQGNSLAYNSYYNYQK